MNVDWSPLWISLRVAGLATALSAVIGLPLAYAVTEREFAAKRALSAVLLALIAAPAPVVVFYLLRGSWVALGRVSPSLRAGFVIMGVMAGLPIFFRTARAAMAGLDPAFAKSARSCGASDWRVFSRVQLPLMVAPLLCATATVFVSVMAQMALIWWITGPGPK